MALKLGSSDVAALYVGASLVDAAFLGADSVLGLAAAPEGFAYLVNADGDFLVNADGAYILAKT